MMNENLYDALDLVIERRDLDALHKLYRDHRMDVFTAIVSSGWLEAINALDLPDGHAQILNEWLRAPTLHMLEALVGRGIDLDAQDDDELTVLHQISVHT